MLHAMLWWITLSIQLKERSRCLWSKNANGDSLHLYVLLKALVVQEMGWSEWSSCKSMIHLSLHLLPLLYVMSELCVTVIASILIIQQYLLFLAKKALGFESFQRHRFQISEIIFLHRFPKSGSHARRVELATGFAAARWTGSGRQSQGARNHPCNRHVCSS